MNYLHTVQRIKELEGEIKALELDIKLKENSLQNLLAAISVNIDIEKNCTPINPGQVLQGQIVVGVGDSGNYCHRIEDVLKPDDPFKAYVADDGCRYGILDTFVISSND